MYSLEEFINNIIIKLDNWDDHGFKTTSVIMIDGKFAIFKAYPHDEDIFKKIYNNDYRDYNMYFVLGNKDYYNLINSKLAKKDREKWYRLTNDIAYNLKLLDELKNHRDFTYIINNSFLRFTKYDEVKNQLHRMTLGGKYLDRYKMGIIDAQNKYEILDIDINPKNDIPTNTFGFIGRNGTGKTYILNNIIKLLLGNDSAFIWKDSYKDNKNKYKAETSSIERIIKISYSPFDRLDSNFDTSEKFIRIGLLTDKNNIHNGDTLFDKMNDRLFDNINDLFAPMNLSSKELWEEILSKFTYEDWANDLFYYIKELEYKDEESNLRLFLDGMSSGQKIILLTITELILNVREKTLVLFDEPELFLHPSLIKSYIRVIIEIITKMNAICIIATHNPLILQELQTKCVKVTDKENDKYVIRSLSDYNVNSFGENVNVLNNMIFGIDIQNTGYYQYLTSKNQNELIKKYDFLMDKLGSEGRVLLNHLIEAINEKNREA